VREDVAHHDRDQRVRHLAGQRATLHAVDPASSLCCERKGQCDNRNEHKQAEVRNIDDDSVAPHIQRAG
jgi:hypothetical protein